MKSRLAILPILLLGTSCVEGNSGDSYYPGGTRRGYYDGYYNDYRRPPATYYGDSYHRPPPRYYDHDDHRYRDRDRDHDRYRHDRDRDWDRRDRDRDEHKPEARPTQPPAPRQPEKIIRPSCGPGFTFDGRSCVIIDKSKIKPGGSGRGNACPSGMWISGDRCVGK